MYKHTALSIKESAEKRFISKSEKDAYNAISSDCISIADSYNRSEIDEKVKNRLLEADMNINIQSDNCPFLIRDTEEGYFSDIEIFGNTEREVSIKRVRLPVVAGSLDSNGQPIANDANTITSDFIEVTPGDVITFYATKAPSYYNYYSRDIKVFMYDKNKNFKASTDILKIFEIPEDVSYIKIETEESIHRSVAPYITIKTDTKKLISVGEKQVDGTYSVKVKCIGKNLFNKNEVKNFSDIFTNDKVVMYNNGNDLETMKFLNHIIRLKPNTKYTVVSKFEKDHPSAIPEMFVITQLVGDCSIIHDSWINPISVRSINNGNMLYKTFTTGNDDIYVRFRFDNNRGDDAEGIETVITYSDIMLYEGEFDPNIEYEEYIEHEIELKLPCQLQKAGNISDRLFIKDGKLFIEKNIKDRYLTCDNSKWTINNITSSYDASCSLFFLYYNDNPNVDIKPESLVQSALFISNHYNKGGECIYNGTVAIAVQMKRSKLNGVENLFGFMEWLRTNPINIVYTTTQPEIIEVSSETLPLLPTVKGDTVILNSTIVNPSKIKASAPTSLNGSLSKNISNIEILKNEVQDMKNVVKKSTYVLETDSRVLNMNSNGETIDEIEIQGKTLRNAHDSKLYSFNGTFNENKSVSNDVFTQILPGNDTSIVFSNGVITVTKNQSEEPQFTNIYIRRDNMNIKPDTVYTYVIEILENTMVTSLTSASGTDYNVALRTGNTNNKDAGHSEMTVFPKSWGFMIREKKVGVYKQLMRTRFKAELDQMTPDMVGDRIFVSKHVTGTIKFRVALIEGDHMDADISEISPKFISVADRTALKVKTTNKNLLNVQGTKYISPPSLPYTIAGNRLTIGDGITSLPSYSCIKYLVYLEKDKNYDIKYNAQPNYSGKSIVDIKYVGKCNTSAVLYVTGIAGLQGGRFQTTYGEGLYQIAFYSTREDATTGKIIFEDIGLYEVHDEYVYNDEPHKSDEVIIDPTLYGIEGGLKSLPDGTCDRIHRYNGKYYLEQNVGQISFTEEQIMKHLYLANTYEQSIEVGIVTSDIPSMNIKNGPINDILSDIFPSPTTADNRGTFSIYVANNSKEQQTLYFRIPSYLLDELTITKAREFMVSRSPIIYYPLKKPIITELDIDLGLRLYEGYNRIEFYTNRVTPKVKIYKSGVLQNTVQNLLSKIRQLSDKEVSLARLTLDSIYTGDLTNYMIDISRGVSEFSSTDTSYDNELFELIYSIVKSGKNNYNLYDMEDKIDFFCIIDKLSFEMCELLFDIMYSENIDIEE